MSIYYAWLLAALFSTLVGWSMFQFVDGFRKSKFKPGDEPGPVACSVAGLIVGAVFFFVYLCLTGAPVNNLDHYNVSGMSILCLGLGVPLLAPLMLAAAGLVCLAVCSVGIRLLGLLQLKLNTLGANARVMVQSLGEYRLAVAQVHDQRRLALTDRPVDQGDFNVDR